MSRPKRSDIPSYAERTYRQRTTSKDLVSFHVSIKETDLWVSADKNLENETKDLVFDCRHQIETYITLYPEFATTLSPFQDDPFAPPIVKKMTDATKKVNVGPMASVAGAIAEHVGKGLLGSADQVIVENGGDIFIRTNRPAVVSIFAGSSPLSEKLGLMIPARQMPLGVCTSSGTVGHSLSLGIADACCVLAPSAAFADAAATALGNRVGRKKDLNDIADWAHRFEEIIGGVVIVADKMAAWGDIELTNL